MDFGLFPDARGTERNGQKRENQAQNRLGSAEGEVRKFTHEPSRTRGNTRDRPRKNPNSDELGFCIWWCAGDRVQEVTDRHVHTSLLGLQNKSRNARFQHFL